MYELAWIALGLMLALAAMAATRVARSGNTGKSPKAPNDGRAIDGCILEPEHNAQPEPPVVAPPVVAPPVVAPPVVEAPVVEAPAVLAPVAEIADVETAGALDATISAESHEVARSLAIELANLVSAVEGRAHHLIEAAPSPSKLPLAAEAMLTSIARLRTLHTKLLAIGRGRPVATGSTDITKMIAGLTDELQQMQLGLEVRWDPPSALPDIDACPAAVRDAMLFVCAALLHTERGATRLTFSTERCFAKPAPAIQIEIQLEWNTAENGKDADELRETSFALNLEAAKQIVHSHAGDITMSRLPGKSACAVVRMPTAGDLAREPDAADTNPSATPTEDSPAAASGAEPALQAKATADDHQQAALPGKNAQHKFGGALVLEADPTLRSVVAGELKASGRAVFACADGASAHTFLQATPDRFELLIVDDAEQLAEHTPLARTIRQHAPDLKICLLTPGAPNAPEQWPQVRCLQKPFGVHDLRRTLASLLSTG